MLRTTLNQSASPSRSGPAHSNYNMPLSELRARIKRICPRKPAPSSVVPFTASFAWLARQMGMRHTDLKRSLAGNPRRPDKDRLGPMRIKKLINIVLKIETGEWEYVPISFPGNWVMHPHKLIDHGAPRRPIPPINTVELTRSGPKIVFGETRESRKMPKFGEIFGL